MKKIFVILATFILVISLSACSNNYTNISNEELTDLLENHYDEYQFVDVRTSDEFYTSRIPGFKINLDYYIFEDDYSLLENLDKDIPVVIMCNSGNRSVSASKIFDKEGFVEIYNLTNGIEGWTGATE